MSYIYTDASERNVKELFEKEFGKENPGVEGYGEKGDSNYKNMQNILGLRFAPKSYITANVREEREVSRMVKILQEQGFNVALEKDGKITYPRREQN